MATSFLLEHKNLLKGAKTFKQRMKENGGATFPIQQSEYLRSFMLTILSSGLEEAYLEYIDNPPGPSPPNKSTHTQLPQYEYDVIIIGAGMAGLSAGYELKRAGLTVQILEQTERCGGRVFTYGKDDNLADGLYGEAGAMRLPGDVRDPPEDRAHFLTDGYIGKFNLEIKKFPNYDPNGLSNIYGFKEKTSDWSARHFDTVWPDWKVNIHGNMVEQVNNIDDYYEYTTGAVTNQLKSRLESAQDLDDEVAIWDHWIDIWSQFTLESFLESNIEVVHAKIPRQDKYDLDFDTLSNLLPWSNDAVRGYSVSSYTEQLDQSLVQYLRDQLGQWWSQHMHTLVGGMHSLPNAFYTNCDVNLKDNVKFHKQVSKIAYFSSPNDPTSDFVKVTCYGINTVPECTYTAQAVIVTTPVNILRQITFKPINGDDEKVKTALRKNIQAIEDIFTGPSTKIILQTRERFWEDPRYNIQGGFSKTNLPIGQIHYVRPDPEYVSTTKQGIILIYTWKNEALSFGSLAKDQVEKEAIEQVSEIHPEITKPGMVEKCIVHAWYNQPSYQGAYGLLKTTQFNNIRYLWDPMGSVYFSGENLSFTTGWIQGALESGLKAAYQVYARHKERLPIKT